MSDWASSVCQTNGIDIHYLRTGGHRPPLVALHGLTGSGACWKPLGRALESEWDDVMSDARGHGSSSAQARGYSYDGYANDVVGLIGALRLDTPILLGHSMGGMTAAIVASRLGSGVRGLVVADPTFLKPNASARSTKVMSSNSTAACSACRGPTRWPRRDVGIHTARPRSRTGHQRQAAEIDPRVRCPDASKLRFPRYCRRHPRANPSCRG